MLVKHSGIRKDNNEVVVGLVFKKNGKWVIMKNENEDETYEIVYGSIKHLKCDTNVVKEVKITKHRNTDNIKSFVFDMANSIVKEGEFVEPEKVNSNIRYFLFDIANLLNMTLEDMDYEIGYPTGTNRHLCDKGFITIINFELLCAYLKSINKLTEADKQAWLQLYVGLFD